MKRLFKIIRFYSFIYWGIYFISCFLKWELYNPFWWILEIPYDRCIRLNVFCVLFIITGIGFFIFHCFLDENGKLLKV